MHQSRAQMVQMEILNDEIEWFFTTTFLSLFSEYFVYISVDDKIIFSYLGHINP